MATNTLLRPGRSALSLLEALATPHGIDRYLELVHPMLSVRDLRAKVVEVQRQTTDSVTLTLRPTHRWRGFRAGQHLALTVDIDGVRRTRYYSPACSQHRRDGRIVITVRAHPDGVVSRHLFEHAVPGLVLGLSQAQGEFALPTPRPADVLLISGGSGITPVLSMLASLHDEGHPGRIAMLHYARSESAVPHRAHIVELVGHSPNRIAAFGYSAQPARGQLAGRFDLDQLRQVAPWFTDAQTFACGPASLIEAVRSQFEAAGLADRLHLESFTPTLVATPAGPATGEVTFSDSARTVANTGQSLLEQAEAAGLSPAHGCRMGICFSCTAIKTAGCTRNLRTGELDADADTEIQLCISAPVGDVAVRL
ncbi:MAG: ferredoxin reductase [Jatrophihabitans sp.]